ncbi:peptidase [Sinorhizobium meliloti]|uniref:peptidase n=1 Tax=Rhizobium meliloti TaxID=382 RepID=UPI00299D5439|nr:peptidase [Sinorhizobium meliloti]
MATETFVSSGGRQVAAKECSDAFCIELRLGDGLNDSHKTAFKQAALRWTQAIIGDVPSHDVNGETIDDIRIYASGGYIDGKGDVLGKCGPEVVRPKRFRKHAYLPVTAVMKLDEDDLEDISQARLTKLVMHEMGHALGLGRWVWGKKGLLESPSGSDPRFIGAAAMAEYGALRGGAPEKVPVENVLGRGHWRESVFDSELMTPLLDHPEDNPMSRITVGALQDIGYEVDFAAADPFDLPVTAAARKGLPFHLEVIEPVDPD